MVLRGARTIDGSIRPSVDRVAEIQSDVVVWAVIDGFLLVMIICGNTLTILAVRFSRRLRSVISNLFVLSLAISDMVVGFTLPYHLAFYMGSGLGAHKTWCLLRFFLIILACCVSIWNLIAIAVDRYIAIVYPLHYSRYITRKCALVILSIGWIVGITIACVPMFWNNWSTATECEFDEVLPPWYMAGIITPIFSLVWVCLLVVYWRIWREATKHAKQLRATGMNDGPSDWKSVQVVLLILGCFSICWLPYFIVACAQIFKILAESSPTLYKGAFSLAMANSGMNPIIYAWKNTNFRRAFSRLLKCKGPDSIAPMQNSMRSNLHRKSSSLHHQDTINGSLPNYSTPPPLQKPLAVNTIIQSNNEVITTTTPQQFVEATAAVERVPSFQTPPLPTADMTICVTNDNGNLSIVINDVGRVNDAATISDDDNDGNNKNLRALSPTDDYCSDDNCHRTTINNQRYRNIRHSKSNSEIITLPPPPVSNKKSMHRLRRQPHIMDKSNNNNEITMTNIIINKCSIMENFENIKNSGDHITTQKYNLSDTETSAPHCLTLSPIECSIRTQPQNNGQKPEFIYKINLVNEK